MPAPLQPPALYLCVKRLHSTVVPWGAHDNNQGNELNYFRMKKKNLEKHWSKKLEVSSVLKWEAFQNMASLLPRWARAQAIRSQTSTPGTVTWGHSSPCEWNLAKETLWRYPFWWLNRLSPAVEANIDKKLSGKATAHGAGMINCLLSLVPHSGCGPCFPNLCLQLL